MTATTSSSALRAMVVEDSLVQQTHLVDVLEADGDIAVVAVAASAPDAIERIAAVRPDVVTVDLQIPGGGGHRVIREVMATAPTPILVLSASVQDARSVPAIEALASGALVALPKPARWTSSDEEQLRRMVRSLRNVAVVRHRIRPALDSQVPKPPAAAAVVPSAPLVALAASAGGPPALASVLAQLGGLTAPVLVVQHIHQDFVEGLVAWLARESALPVTVAHHGEVARVGRAYVGPADVHLRVDAQRRIHLDPTPAAIHRPAADELFASVANHIGPAAVGVVLTGMGNDGARGLLALRTSGGHTIAQDAASSAVYGMPKAAAAAGAVVEVLPLDDIPAAVIRAVARLAR